MKNTKKKKNIQNKTKATKTVFLHLYSFLPGSVTHAAERTMQKFKLEMTIFTHYDLRCISDCCI